MRLRNVDLLKGVLIILVIVGHILLGSTEQSLPRYIIYCFHIPVFIGLSGFLFNYTKMGQLSLKGFISKYLFRIILPWVIAVLVYKLILNFNVIVQTHDYRIFTGAFKLPYNHLWFIAAYFSWITITWLAGKLHVPLWALLVFAIGLVVTVYFIRKYPPWDAGNPSSQVYSSLIFQIYRPHLYIYFVIGLMLRNNSFSIKIWPVAIVTLSLFVVLMLSFLYRFSFVQWLLYFFNTGLLFILVQYAKKDSLPHAKWIEWIGVNSMAVYLWHMVPLIIVSQHIPASPTVLYYTVSFAAVIAFSAIIYFLTKIKPVNKYLFGMY